MYLPALVAVAALGLTYLFCIRPMRRGAACFSRGVVVPQTKARSDELERVRTELDLLRLRQRERENLQTPG